MTKETYSEVLIKYIPEAAVDQVYHLIIKHSVFLAITRERKTKHGDFRPAVNGKPSRISVNHNLNKYAFLITFLHELAHQITWNKYKSRVRPHGHEWKKEFYDLLQQFRNGEIFPSEILENLEKGHHELMYSTLADTDLARQLKRYDNTNGLVLLETLADNTTFMLPNGRKFKKLSKRRKNFLCINLDNQRKYVFNPLAEVIALNHE